tara:strand:- start:28436 stop:30346 length:1911 start_codon:yes stop_codon:yes gene_type:complete
MTLTKFSNLDFDQIKTSIKDYLRSNTNFSDFDFEGSNFSVLIDTLAYNTYITAFNSNLIVNESFLDSATVRENVVSLSSNIGYTPRSRTAAIAQVDLELTILDDANSVNAVSLQPGLVCTGDISDSSYLFSIVDKVTTPVVDKIAKFEGLNIYQGTFLKKKFEYDGSLDQRFILDNPNIDSSKVRVYISSDQSELGIEYSAVNNIISINSDSRIYFIREIQDERYELRFGDGIFGKKLGDYTGSDGKYITVHYMTTEGEDGNGAQSFTYAGIVNNENDVSQNITNVRVTKKQSSQNGSAIENIDSIKYYSPLLYSAQNRAVTARDYEAIIKRIYPNTESVSVVGGEELDPPEFGTVRISIKPTNGSYVSDFSKSNILSKLKQYSVSGINQSIVDLKVLYVEIDSSVYYNDAFISDPNTLKSSVVSTLTNYSKSVNLNKFGGRFKYSKVLQTIDDTDQAITSNITKVRIRRDLKVSVNQFAQYELCFGNQFHVDPKGFNIKSTGFNIPGEQSTVYLTDVPKEDRKTGALAIIKPINDTESRVIVGNAGVVDYIKGEVTLTTVKITSTVKPNDIIEIQAFPESNDVVGLKDLYISFSISESTINMVRDVIASGDEISGVKFTKDFYTSSYSNGKITRE